MKYWIMLKHIVKLTVNDIYNVNSALRQRHGARVFAYFRSPKSPVAKLRQHVYVLFVKILLQNLIIITQNRSSTIVIIILLYTIIFAS